MYFIFQAITELGKQGYDPVISVLSWSYFCLFCDRSTQVQKVSSTTLRRKWDCYSAAVHENCPKPAVTGTFDKM